MFHLLWYVMVFFRKVLVNDFFLSEIYSDKKDRSKSAFLNEENYAKAKRKNDCQNKILS